MFIHILKVRDEVGLVNSYETGVPPKNLGILTATSV